MWGTCSRYRYISGSIETLRDKKDGPVYRRERSDSPYQHGSIRKHTMASLDTKYPVETTEPALAKDDSPAGADINPRAERALVWKFDLRVLPVLAVMYLFNSLDKSNVGNAKTAGLEKTLNLKGNEYNLILSIFFIPYVLTAPFLGILGKKYGPNRVLPCMMFAFGLCTILVVAVFNFSGLLAIRWFLGMAESAFFPLVIYYLTTYVRLASLQASKMTEADSTAGAN